MKVVRHHFSSIDSTNTWAKEHAASFDPNAVTLVTADGQTGGRGRFKRRWESPSHQNVYATFCFFVENRRQDIGNFPQVLALSAAEALRKLEFPAKLKWPNDLLLSGKKIAGILSESTHIGEQLCLILGIGLNVNMPSEHLQKIDRPATSLFAETNQNFDVEDILSRLQASFLPNLKKMREESFSPFLPKYRTLLAHQKGEKVQFHDDRKIWQGMFHAIDEEGALKLEVSPNDIKTFFSGEILFN